MSDLTEKWEAGRLYYVKKKNGKIVIRQAHLYSCLRTEKAMPFVYFDDNDIEKVMAAVPSYEKLQELKEENARLKGLLKECQTIISNNLYEFDSDDCSRSCDLIKDIEEALR